MNDKIYPSMVIRSQAEAIKLLEKENQLLKEKYLNAVADYEETKSEWQELHNKIDKAIKLLQQYLPNYASCIKLLDELEELLKDSDLDE